MYIKYMLSLAIVLGFAGWSTAQSSAKYMKIVPQVDGTLYFIKPVKLKNADGEKLEIDFTYFHNKIDPTGVVDVKFSVYTKMPVKSIDRVIFNINKDKQVNTLPGISLMYTEQQKGKWISRFSATLSLDDLKELVKPENAIYIWPETANPVMKRFEGGGTWKKVSSNIWGIFATML